MEKYKFYSHIYKRNILTDNQYRAIGVRIKVVKSVEIQEKEKDWRKQSLLHTSSWSPPVQATGLLNPWSDLTISTPEPIIRGDWGTL